MVLNIVFCITIKALQRLNDITAHCLGKKSSTRSHCDVIVSGLQFYQGNQ